MDDEVGLPYMKEHFEPYTRSGDPRCLIVDGYSSYIVWRAAKYDLYPVKAHQSPSTPRCRVIREEPQCIAPEERPLSNFKAFISRDPTEDSE